MRFLAENPALPPYSSDNKDLNSSENDLEKCRVLSPAEMVAGFMVSLQLAEQPNYQRIDGAPEVLYLNEDEMRS